VRQIARLPILLSIVDPLQARIAAEVCNDLHFGSTPLHDPTSLTPAAGVVALIYDGTPRDNAAEIVRKLRERRPLLPIHLFVPMRPGVTAAILAAGRIAGVTVSEYWRQTQDRDALASVLTRLVPLPPFRAVREGLSTLKPLVASTLSMAVVDSILQLHSQRERPTLKAIASELGTSFRSLLRHWPMVLGRPKSFCDELTLLLALRAREWANGNWARTAADMGISEATMRRVRKRQGGDSATDPAIPFLSIARRCRADDGDIRRGLARLLQ